MLSIAHTATGAIIATAIPNPLISFPLIIASHYLEDYILHWDVGTGLSSGKKKKRDAILHEFVDLGLSVFFLWIVFQKNHSGINFLAWYGAFVSLLPDFIEAPKNFLKWEPKITKPLNDFHGLFHHSTPDVIKGLTPQLIILFAIYILAK